MVDLLDAILLVLLFLREGSSIVQPCALYVLRKLRLTRQFPHYSSCKRTNALAETRSCRVTSCFSRRRCSRPATRAVTSGRTRSIFSDKSSSCWRKSAVWSMTFDPAVGFFVTRLRESSFFMAPPQQQRWYCQRAQRLIYRRWTAQEYGGYCRPFGLSAREQAASGRSIPRQSLA